MDRCTTTTKTEEGSPKPNTNFPGFTTEKEMGGCHNTLKANQGEINTSVQAQYTKVPLQLAYVLD